MKNAERWRPTKFVMRGQRLRASRDNTSLSSSSRFITDVLAPRYQALLRDHARGRLLDLGAGAVPLYEVYRGLVDTITCVDWSQCARPVDHIDAELDLNEPLPFDDASYDTVLLTDVLEHVHRPHGLFAEISRVLAEGGKLLLSVPFFYWIHEGPHDYARYTSFMLRKFCEENRLVIHTLDATGGSPEVLLDLLGRHLSWSNTLATLHGEVAGWVLRIPGVASLSRYSSKWFPQGYVLVAERGSRP